MESASEDDRHSPSTTIHPPTKRHILRRIVDVAFLAVWLGGLLLRLTVRDAVQPLAVWYYATPLVVLAATALAAGGILLIRKRRRWGGVAILAGVICGVWWWQATMHHHSPQSADGSLRVLSWNCRHGYHGWKRIAEEIHRVDAPLVGLVEAGARTPEERDFWRWEFLNYNIATPGGGIVFLTRGEIVRTEYLRLGHGSRCGRFRVRIDGRDLIVFVVDIASNPLTPRRAALRRLAQLVESHAGQPVLVLGDFNTPADSALLEPLRAHCTNAFEASGNGNAATWPVPAPVLTLDQVWINDALQAVGCRHLSTSVSDHRQVVTDVAFTPVAPP